MQTATITGSTVNLTSTSARRPGPTLSLRLSATGNTNIAFNSSWKFMGAKPSVLPANKVSLLTLQCYGTSEEDIIAAFSTEN